MNRRKFLVGAAAVSAVTTGAIVTSTPEMVEAAPKSSPLDGTIFTESLPDVPFVVGARPVWSAWCDDDRSSATYGNDYLVYNVRMFALVNPTEPSYVQQLLTALESEGPVVDALSAAVRERRYSVYPELDQRAFDASYRYISLELPVTGDIAGSARVWYDYHSTRREDPSLLDLHRAWLDEWLADESARRLAYEVRLAFNLPLPA